MEVQIITKGMNRHDKAGMALGKAECGAHVVNQALVRQTAQILEQVAVEAEIDAEHLGDTEREVAVRDGKEDRLGQQGAEELNLLLVTRRAEPAAFTGEGQQILVFAVIAPDTRKTSLQVATVQELVHHIRNGAPEVPALESATLSLVMEPASKGQVPRRGFASRPSVSLLTPYGPGRFKGPVGSPLIASTLTLEASASRSRPHRIVCFRRRAILRRFVPHPRKMANVRRLVLAKASHPHTNRRGRLAPPTAGSAFRVPVSTNASPVRPFQAPRTRLRLEAAFGGRCWRAARVVPGTAIGPGSKFRPDRCRHLLRPLKRGTSLASLARQPFRRARRITGACTRYATPVSAPAKKRKGQVPCHGVASRPSVKSTTIYSPGSSILGGHPIHRYAHRVSLVLPCATFGGPPIIQDEPHAHSSPSATPCASPNT